MFPFGEADNQGKSVVGAAGGREVGIEERDCFVCITEFTPLVPWLGSGGGGLLGFGIVSLALTTVGCTNLWAAEV
jgi:hypothetical protein